MFSSRIQMTVDSLRWKLGTTGLHRHTAFIPFSHKNMKIFPLKHACGVSLTQGQPSALGKKTLQVSHYDKGTVIQEYIQGLHHVTPGGEQQDLKMNSEAQQQHEERQRWAAAERTKCLSDSLVSWRLYEFPGILWRDFQTREVGDLLWNMWADRTWIVKVRIKGRTHSCSCRTERCQFSFLCCGKLLKSNAALTGLRPVAALLVSVHVVGFPRFRVRPVGAFN